MGDMTLAVSYLCGKRTAKKLLSKDEGFFFLN